MSSEQFKEILLLLQENKLPTEDLFSPKVAFFTVEENNQIIACVGLEKCDNHGLVRSLAVKKHYRGRGIGIKLLQELEAKSKTNNIIQLHLLTTTAKDYFIKLGYKIGTRFNAPECIKKTKEFENLCPESAVYLFKSL